jgi:microcystin-dependent protein
MATPYLGEIRMFAGNFAPSGWALCNGQLLAISQNTALFSILGTNFGGNGTSTFALPDLRGRVPVNQGQGLGLSTYVVGEQTGSENITLLQNQMPAHTHLVACDNNGADTTLLDPTNNFVSAQPTPQQGGNGIPAFSASSNQTMNPQMITPAGGSQPFSIIQPLLCVTFIIALVGIFPSRN